MWIPFTLLILTLTFILLLLSFPISLTLKSAFPPPPHLFKSRSCKWEKTWHLSFWVWFILLSMRISSFPTFLQMTWINITALLFFMADWKLHRVCKHVCICVYVFFIHPSVDRHRLVPSLGNCELYVSKHNVEVSLFCADFHTFENLAAVYQCSSANMPWSCQHLFNYSHAD